LISVDKENGNLQWQTKRQTSSAWASPSLISTNGREIIVISASRTVIAYDATNGESLWELSGIIGNNVPSVTVSGNWMAIGSNRKGHCRVLRLKEGQVEEVWRSKEATSSFGSPFIYKGRVYFVNKTGFLFCHDLKTGVLLYDYRLPSSTWATPLATDDHAWFFTQSGHTVILKASDELEVSCESSIDIGSKDRVFGYAVMNGHVVFRTKKQLICVGK
jgi:outer membrane protein assembly factor BamB